MKTNTKVIPIMGKRKDQVGTIVSPKGHNVTDSSVAVKFDGVIVVMEKSILKLKNK